ncbi:PEP-CTERM sorting domain-containing protein [Ruficoccus amylovorans]|uniref:PEP-CTERM sorting domain-containing protein n=1 Tax=Ruficoccus amylovorans TaxID=1804625 RepID=A0A842HCH7_9BACT|nr:PEP-CTERM sorting domain-containing protein [Ruficoccus amylovorans]MBC2594195.1 PEP-CTERM sorting domain-containing protein [Ruficoccus amylovorans]
MYTKQLLLGLLCSTAALQAEVSLNWIGGDNTVHAEFNYYSTFSSNGTATGADSYVVKDNDGNVVSGGLAGLDGPDIMSLNGKTQRFSDGSDHWLETTANWDLSIWMPGISGYETQEFCVQISYFAYFDGSSYDYAWRQNYDLGISTYNLDADTASSILGTIHSDSFVDTDNGIVTEVFTFTVGNAADGVFIDIGATPGLSVDNPSYITWIEIDSVSYDAVPEPSTYGMLTGLAVIALLVFRRRRHAAA